MDHTKLTVCRCCLAENKKLKDMTEPLIAAKKSKGTLITCYSTCSGVDLPSQNRLHIPSKICKPCEKKLIIAYEFRELCQASDQVLQERGRSSLEADVKKESLSDEEMEKEYLFAESKPDPDQPSQAFNQVFLKDHSDEVTLIDEVIKIEDDASDYPPPERKLEIEKCSEDKEEPVKSPGSDDNAGHDYDPEAASSTDEDVGQNEDPKEEQTKNEDHEVDTLSGKFLCYQCDLVLQTIREYRGHRKICIETRKRQSCKICGQEVKGYKRHLEEKHKDFKPFECGTCEAKFAQFNSLRIHLYYHTKLKTFQCMARWCGLKFHSPADLRRHIIDNNKHKINHYHCHVCGSNHPKFQELAEHFQIHKDDDTVNIVNRPLVPCFQCKKVFIHRKVFFAHKCEPVANILERWQRKKSKGKFARNALALRWTKVIIDTTPQTCPMCQKVFTNDDEFACHKSSECIEKRKFICADCGKEFITLQRMKSHSEVHNKNRQYICDMCGVSFISKAGLATHKISHTNGRSFKCDQCPASFVDKNGLKSHSFVHVEKKFECDFCARRFRKYDNIRLHMSIHSMDLQKFLCDTCDKRFPRNADLKKHIKMFHSGMKPMNCGFCKRVFRDHAVFKRHQRDMHSQITYECAHCQKMFNTGEGLKAHLFVHRGFHPFNCPACPRKFIKKYMFSKHLMKGHNIKYDEKTHGYRETELNMRQILLDAERRPNSKPPSMDQVGMDFQVNDTDMTNTKTSTERIDTGPSIGVLNYPAFPPDSVSWNMTMTNQPFGGYPHSN